MKKLKFFYDYVNNNYRCSLTDEEGFTNIKIDKAKEYLRGINFDNAFFSENTIFLNGEDIEVVIEDADKSNVLFDILKNNYKLIKKSMKEVGKCRSTNKFPLNIIRNQKIIAGGLVFLTVAGIKILSSSPSMAVEVPQDIFEGTPIEYREEIQVIEPFEEVKIQEVKDVEIVSKPVVIEEEKSVLVKEPEPKLSVELSHATALDTPTYQNAYEKYHELVTSCAERWGLDPNLIMAMLTQESAGKLVNLMQFNFNSFKGGKITVYNYEEHKYQTFFFTDNPKYETNEKYIVVRSNDLNDAETNINMGCIYERYNIDSYKNPWVSIMTYNQGCGNMNKIFAETKYKTGVDKEEICSSLTDTSFYENAFASYAGDKYYLDNVFRYFNSNELRYKILVNGEEIEIVIELVNPVLEQVKVITMN